MSYWQNSPALTEDVSINGFPVCWTCCFVSKVGYLDTPRSYGLSWLIISSPFKKDRVLAYHFFWDKPTCQSLLNGTRPAVTIPSNIPQGTSLNQSSADLFHCFNMVQQVTRVSRSISSTHHVSWRRSCARSLFQHVWTRDSFVVWTILW